MSGSSLSASAGVQAEISGIIPFIWEKIVAFRTEKQSAEGLFEALRFEVCYNRDLLAAIKIDALKDVNITDTVFRGFVENLRTEVAASILFSQNRRNHRRFLAYVKKQMNGGAEETIGGMFKALSFVVRKVEALKGITRFAECPHPLCPDYDLVRRVENIRKNLQTLDTATCFNEKEPSDTEP